MNSDEFKQLLEEHETRLVKHIDRKVDGLGEERDELRAIRKRLDLHEQWIKQLAKKTGTKLDPEP